MVLYNHYIPQDTVFEEIPEDGAPRQKSWGAPPPGDEKNAGLAGIFQRLTLANLDTGDILLMIILFLILREGDHADLVLILALVLILGSGSS